MWKKLVAMVRKINRVIDENFDAETYFEHLKII